MQTNAATGIQVSIGSSYTINKSSTGYQLILQTSSDSAYQALPDNEVFCQLGFSSTSQTQSAFLLGVQQPRTNNQGERTYVFTITADYDIDSNDILALPSFITSMAGQIPRAALTQPFNVLFSTNAPTAVSAPTTTIDSLLGRAQLPSGVIGVTQEILTVQFGYSLEYLWNSYRTIVAPVSYQTYLANVPKTYLTNVYSADPTTGADFTVVNGTLTWNILHKAGDPVLDSNGNPVYLHMAGDPPSLTQLPDIQRPRLTTRLCSIARLTLWSSMVSINSLMIPLRWDTYRNWRHPCW